MVRAVLAGGCLLALLLPGSARAAAPTAEYRVTFDATWSAATHPVPPDPHFSGIVGGLHSDAVRFYALGELASLGIEKMAEVGSQGYLIQEVDAAIAAGHAEASLAGGGIAPSPGSVSIEFTASQAFPRLTLVSMVAPSPDWFVGVDGLELWNGQQWLANAVVTLYALDAGTDDGENYLSPDADSTPHVPIAAITSGPLGNGEPLGTFTITRLDLDPVPATSVAQRRVLAVLLLLAALALVLRERLRGARS